MTQILLRNIYKNNQKKGNRKSKPRGNPLKSQGKLAWTAGLIYVFTEVHVHPEVKFSVKVILNREMADNSLEASIVQRRRRTVTKWKRTSYVLLPSNPFHRKENFDSPSLSSWHLFIVCMYVGSKEHLTQCSYPVLGITTRLDNRLKVYTWVLTITNAVVLTCPFPHRNGIYVAMPCLPIPFWHICRLAICAAKFWFFTPNQQPNKRN